MPAPKCGWPVGGNEWCGKPARTAFAVLAFPGFGDSLMAGDEPTRVMLMVCDRHNLDKLLPEAERLTPPPSATVNGTGRTETAG